MKNVHQQLKWVREHVRDLNTSVFEERCKEALRSAWKTKESAPSSHGRTIAKKPLSLARAFGFAMTGLAVIFFAAVSSFRLNEIQKEAQYKNQRIIQEQSYGSDSMRELGLYYGEAMGLASPSRQSQIISSILEPFTDDRVYTYGDGKQLFDESIGYDMKIKGESDDKIISIRTQATNLGGAVVYVRRYDEVGETVVMLQMPRETITVFEAYLESLALPDTFRRSEYEVKNVSEKVVVIEKDIARDESALKRFMDQLAQTNSTTIRRRIERNIAEAERSIKEKNAERMGVIQKYDMVDVSVRITEKKSFLSGAYWQYDRETVGGAIAYQISRGLFMIINTLGFMMSLLFYSILAIVVWKIGKRLFGRRRRDVDEW